MKGRRGRGRGKSLQRDFRQKQTDEFRQDSQWIDDSQRHNAKFEAYYKKQGIIEESEWEAFMAAARTELPVVFRISGRGPYSQELRHKLETDFFSKLANVKKERSDAVDPPKALPWYPDHLAWQFAFSRRELRRDPSFEPLHEYIKHETALGNISRQEAVSMIPPLVLDVQSHHRVLDMCAAPGSKTVQLLEMLHGDQAEVPTGYIIANDVDFQRCNMMTHQVKRMVSPNILITSADAAFFPNGSKVTDGKQPLVEFDRILADVPCSGDGTTRKNPEVWRKWKLHDGSGLHPLQLRIALRAVKLLAVGGLMVYSTCSMNPIEDEAVVAEVYRRSEGALELIDLTEKLPQLNSRKGKRTWIVQDDTREYENYDAAVEYRTTTKKKVDIDPSFFPPAADENIPLERCIRLLPHLNDSGGFFVALFRKVKHVEDITVPSVRHRVNACPDDIRQTYFEERDKRLGRESKMATPVKRESTVEDAEDAKESVAEEDPNRHYFKGIDPIISMENHRVTKEVTHFYGLEGIDLGKNLISRNLNNDDPRKAYFISTPLKQLIDADWDKAIRITALGQQVLTRAFQRKEGTLYACVYRFCQEGLPLMLPFITKQKLFLKVSMMKYFLENKSIRIQNPNEPDPEEKETVSDPHVVNQITKLEQGGCVVLLDDEDAAAMGFALSTESGAGLTSRAPLAVSSWLISPYTLNLMVQKEDVANMLQRIEEKFSMEGIKKEIPEYETEDIPDLLPEKDAKKAKLN